MQYAVVDGERREAFFSGKALCSMCGSAMLAKCGPCVIHHWAHFGRRNCDPWWENETPWHREWKSRFPQDYREICHVASDGEVHRADIKTPNGIVIEVQHSSMPDAERLSREAFYRNLVWIIDGSTFRKNFDIYHLLPDPTSELGQDLVWHKAQRHMNGANAGIFVRRSERDMEYPVRGGYLHFMHEIEKKVEQAYRGHHQYDWVRPRRTWLDATCPVYIDFGQEWLAKLETYDETGLPCIRIVSKQEFVHEAMIQSEARDILKQFTAYW
jgi:hypothetical protein